MLKLHLKPADTYLKNLIYLNKLLKQTKVCREKLFVTNAVKTIEFHSDVFKTLVRSVALCQDKTSIYFRKRQISNGNEAK